MIEFNVNLGIVFSGTVAASTVVYAILTCRLVSETRSLRKAQTDPQVSVRVESDRGDHDGLLELVIRNHGGGAAQNITLGFEGDPAHFGTNYPIDQMAIIADGIHYLEPHGIWQIPLGWFNDEAKFERAMQNPWVFNVEYEDPLGNVKTDVFTIDFRQFSGLWFTSSPMSRIAKRVESMEGHIKRVANGGKLHVITQTKGELIRELEQKRRERRQRG